MMVISMLFKRNLKTKDKKKSKIFSKTIKKIFNKNKKEKITLKEQIFSMFYFELLGFIICLLLLFALSGGRNYFKLYKELNKLINVYDTITSNYYGNIDKNKMIDSAIQTMLEEAGDNYTTYTNQEDTTSFLENINGTYEGIGCTVGINQNGEIYVVSLFEKSSAKAAGLQENDIILKVDDEDLTGKTPNDISQYIKNSTNSKVKLTIKRNNEQLTITITRKKVEIPSVEGKVLENNNKKIGYIKISVFSTPTYEQFKKELAKLEKESIQALIIDVRNNTGGYLSSVTDITSMFLKKGLTIYQLENEKKNEVIKDKTKESRNYPIAVIINAGSASASEIFASAIKESYQGFVVGTPSFGKGTVQKTKKLSDGTMIKYTIQKWLTPNGNWINETGVIPTDFIEQTTTQEIENNIIIEGDRQLQKAIDLVSNTLN